MGTMILTSLIGAVTEEGVKRLSKTKVAANIGGLNGVLVLLPGVIAKDPMAIGQLVVLLVTWAMTIWGRGNKA